MTTLLFHCIPCAWCSYLNVLFAFRNTFHANSTRFYSKQKEHICLSKGTLFFFFFSNIHTVYIVYILVFSSFPGRHRTHWVQRHATLALLLHSTVGWLAGVMSSRQASLGEWIFLVFIFMRLITDDPYSLPLIHTIGRSAWMTYDGGGVWGWSNKLQME